MKRSIAALIFVSLIVAIPAGPAQAESAERKSIDRELCPRSGTPLVVGQTQSVGLLAARVDRMSRSAPSTHTSPAFGTGSRAVTPWVDLTGPYGAYVMHLAVDENNPGTIFCTTLAGGVFRSTDGAGTWSSANSGMYYDYPKQIALDPSNSNTLYCASNSYWRPDGNSDIYKSIDGGDTWSALGMVTSYWGGIHICRNDPNVIVAGSDNGIWRSVDGGATWGWVYGSATVLSFCEDRSAPDTIYAGTYGQGIYRSTDRGATWSTISIPSCGNIRIVAVHPQDSNTIYAAGNPTGLFRSTDYGATWSNVKAFEAWGVACAPTNGDVVYAVGEGPAFSGTPGVHVSTDAGATWTECTLPTEHYYAPFAMRAAVDPADPDTAYVGLYRAGVFKTTDGGATWSDANIGLKNTFVNDIISHPDDPTIVWAATFQAGLYKSTDAGQTWFHSETGWEETNHAVNALAIDPSDPDHLLLGGSNSGVWQSFDGGATWTVTSLQSYGTMEEITFAPSDPSQVWTGSTNSSATLGIWKSTDGGTSWLRKKSGVACYSVSVHPTDPDIVVATTGTWFLAYATIQYSTDGGDTWSTVYQEGFGWVTDSCFSLSNPSIVWATSHVENILASVNSGASWFSNVGGHILPGRPFTIEADPANQKVAYLPLDDDAGFYFTLDYGMSWNYYTQNLWNRALVPLHLGSSPNCPRIYYTGTMGYGAYAALLYY